MKKYSVYELKVVKVGTGSEERYLICRYNGFRDVYVEIFTNEKIKVSNLSYVTPLSKYYSLMANCNFKTGKSLMLSKKELLKKYISINKINFVNKEENKCLVLNNNKILKKIKLPNCKK